MKKPTLALLALALALTGSVRAQFAGGSSPALNGIISKLFGDNPTFSANIEIQTETPGRGNTSIPGKIAYDSGKSRFEMNLSDAKGGQMSPAMAEHMKQMGMDQTIAISRPDKSLTYIIYPGLNAYVETPLQDPYAGKSESDFKIQSSELGRETVDGHPCIKNKVVITDDQGKTHEYTVWNATDLKKFPVKIETNDEGHNGTISFSNIKTAKPDPALFEPSSDFKKYTDQRELFQQEMMKRMGVMKMPPGHPPVPQTPQQ